MLPADCLIKRSDDGSMEFLVVETPSGRRFRVVKPLRSGGVGRVYLVIGLGADGSLCKFALKEYPRAENDDERMNQANIRANLEALIRQPVTDEDGAPLKTMVAPIEIVDFPKTGTFGYVMDYVDLEEYISVNELLGDYPDADVLCRIGKTLAHFFDRLAGAAGMCYKDVNEGNIYIHRITGDVRIIDNDNVGAADVRTIAGTPFYMAPEVQSGRQLPDRVTDRFSLAVFLLRLLTGAYPYEGRKALDMMESRGITVFDAAPEIFGEDAVFVFDPTDPSNGIRGYRPGADATDEQLRRAAAWSAQCEMWDALPELLQEAFTRTLARGAAFDNRSQRLTAREWRDLFAHLEQTLIRCPECGRMIFGTLSLCPHCDAAVPTVICASCGGETPADAAQCIHCGSAPDAAPEQTASCPHCGTVNGAQASLCRACGRYIRITCAKCGSIHPGDHTICSACGSALYHTCPECGRLKPHAAAKCLHCGALHTPAPQRCTCGRTALPGQVRCIRCGRLLNGSEPGPARILALEMDLKLPQGVEHVCLSHHFPSEDRPLFHADDLHPSLPHEALFSLLYHRTGDRFALENRTDYAIDFYAPGNRNLTGTLPPGQRILFAPGCVIRFSDALQLRVCSIK